MSELGDRIEAAVVAACADAPDAWTALRRGFAIGLAIGTAFDHAGGYDWRRGDVAGTEETDYDHGTNP